MKLKELSKGTITILIVLVIFASVGVYKTGYSIGSTVGKSFKIDNAITKVLEEECDCKEVNQLIYAKGLQFSKKKGFSTEKIEYQLIDCQFSNIEDYSNKINKALNKKIDDFENFDMVSLEFVNGNLTENVIIKNGKLQ